MSRISIFAIGKLPKEYSNLQDHFLTMLGKDLSLKEILPKKNINGPEAIELEGNLLLDKVRAEDYVILLDVMGKKMDSIALANFISQTLGTKKITFIIGGAHGVAQKVKARANIAISFSDMTFPHMLVRIILLEQIYRSKSILSGHPYHK